LHWFDAPLVLGRLAAITPAVALLGDHMRESEAQTLALAIAAELIEDPPLERSRFRYTEVLGTSLFSEVEVISVEADRTWTPDEVIGMVYSTAAASPERLGQNRPEFEARVRRELKPYYSERVIVDAVVGRRPNGGSKKLRVPSSSRTEKGVVENG
jgi:hypothetical protein